MQLDNQSKNIKNKNSSIAWFKLSELISRGEKEKALNLYRLISHSFADKAYVLQVEGDILWSFEDCAALEKYKQAAFLYEKEKRATAATAIYEHLLTLEPKNYNYLIQLITLYTKLDWWEKLKLHFNNLFELLKKGEVSKDQAWDAVEISMNVSKKIKTDSKLPEKILIFLKDEIPELEKKAKKLFSTKKKEIV